MTKRLIDLDDELLASARTELGTSGVSDTVRAALRHATASAARARQVQWLTEGVMTWSTRTTGMPCGGSCAISGRHQRGRAHAAARGGGPARRAHRRWCVVATCATLDAEALFSARIWADPSRSHG